MQITPDATPEPFAPKSRFRFESEGRITGYVPVWGQQGPAVSKPPAVKPGQVTEHVVHHQKKEFAHLIAAPASEKAGAKSLSGAAPDSGPPVLKPAAAPFGFFDLIDMVNPLQHIPVVGTIYRNLTGDEIKPVSKIVGGGAFGGILGVASGLVDAAVEAVTGKDIGANLSGDLSRTFRGPDGTQSAAFVAAQKKYNS